MAQQTAEWATAAKALGMIGDTSAIEPLITASKSSEEQVVLSAAKH
jgi:HEAT repeat protein